MNITFPPKNFKDGIEDRKFLENLGHKLYYTIISEWTPNMRGPGGKVVDFHYHKIKLEVSEIEKILSLINPQTGIAMTPMIAEFGFSVGFDIIYTFDKKKDS